MLLVLYTIQIYKSDKNLASFGVDVWIDNKEYLSSGGIKQLWVAILGAVSAGF